MSWLDDFEDPNNYLGRWMQFWAPPPLSHAAQYAANVQRLRAEARSTLEACFPGQGLGLEMWANEEALEIARATAMTWETAYEIKVREHFK